MTDNLEYRIGKVALEPGDILVVKVDERRLSREQQDTLRSQLEPLIKGHKCVVLDGSMDISVLTVAEIQARASSEENAA